MSNKAIVSIIMGSQSDWSTMNHASKILKLFNGGITNVNKDNAYTLNFSETDFDLSEFSTKTITRSKVQELESIQIFGCLKDFFQSNELNKNKQGDTQ